MTVKLQYTNVKTTIEQQDAMFVTLSGLDRKTLRSLSAGQISGSAASADMRAILSRTIATGHYVLVSE